MATPLAVQRKIVWAEQHFRALVAQCDRHIQQHLDALKVDAEPSQDTLPTDLALILGDGLQNLRSALDYLVFELVIAADGDPAKLQTFPICESSATFKDATRGRKFEGFPKEMIAEIEALQPYHAGDSLKAHPFWILNHLTNVNKHRRILLVSLRRTVAGKIPGTNDYTQIPVDAGTQVYMDVHEAVYIAVDEAEFPDKPDVCSLVDQLVKAVELILPNFDQFF